MSYINGGAICDYRKRKHELMGYIQGEPTKKPEKFKAESFHIDTEKLQAICPAGQLSSKSIR